MMSQEVKADEDSTRKQLVPQGHLRISDMLRCTLSGADNLLARPSVERLLSATEALSELSRPQQQQSFDDWSHRQAFSGIQRFGRSGSPLVGPWRRFRRVAFSDKRFRR